MVENILFREVCYDGDAPTPTTLICDSDMGEKLQTRHNVEPAVPNIRPLLPARLVTFDIPSRHISSPSRLALPALTTAMDYILDLPTRSRVTSSSYSHTSFQSVVQSSRYHTDLVYAQPQRQIEAPRGKHFNRSNVPKVAHDLL